jgi:hypothetical protein
LPIFTKRCFLDPDEFFPEMSFTTLAQTPSGVQIQCLRDQIRDPTLTHFSLEARALLLEQFPAYSDSLNFRTNFPAGSGCRTSPKLHIFVDLSVHASDLLSSSDHRNPQCIRSARQNNRSVENILINGIMDILVVSEL